MTIRYQCEECGAALNINDELAGTEGSCPRCHVEFTVPSVDGAAAKSAKAEKPKFSGSLDSEDAIGDFLSSDEIPVATGHTSLAEAEAPDSDDEDPFAEEPPRRSTKSPLGEDGDEDSQAVSPKKKAKGSGKVKKEDSTDSAAIARNLMGKGEAVVRDEPEPAQKKKRRQFGAGSDRPEGEISSVKEMITYFAKMGWPFFVGVTVFLGLCIWISMSMMKSLDLPPLANVSGTVTIDGKPVPTSTIVIFRPEEAVKNHRIASSTGFTDASGKYTLVYTNGVPGAAIGKHRVLIQANDPLQLIPLRYGMTTSDLIVEVTKEGKPIDISLKSDPPPTQE